MPFKSNNTVFDDLVDLSLSALDFSLYDRTISNVECTSPYTISSITISNADPDDLYERACIGEKRARHPKVSRVVFNPPATVVIWEDGTKTIVKCGENDSYDKEKGLALCYMKKLLGNTSRALNDALAVCYEEVPAPKKKKRKVSPYDISHIDVDAMFDADKKDADPNDAAARDAI